MEKFINAVVGAVKKLSKSQLKQVILVREDLKLPPGKMAAQVAHACLEAVLSSNKKLVDSWRGTGGTKIVLRVKDLADLKKRIEAAQKEGLMTSIITDAGH